MNIVNSTVNHIAFGKGTIIKDDNGAIYVSFENNSAEKKFRYTDSFESAFSEFHRQDLRSKSFAMRSERPVFN